MCVGGGGVLLLKQGWNRDLPIPCSALLCCTTPPSHSVTPKRAGPLASRFLPELGAMSGDSLAVPPKETECRGSCLATVDALKYLELETTANCPIQASTSWDMGTPENLCGMQGLPFSWMGGADEQGALESMAGRPSLSLLPSA